MEEGENEDLDDELVLNANQVVICAVKFIALLIVLAICMRIPMPPVVKFPLALGLIYLGWMWIWRSVKKINSSSPLTKGKKAESREDFRAAIKFYEKAAGKPPKPGHNAVRLLVAYDKAGEFGRAKALIQHLNGKEFPETTEDELREVVQNYFPVEIEPSINGVRMKLL